MFDGVEGFAFRLLMIKQPFSSFRLLRKTLSRSLCPTSSTMTESGAYIEKSIYFAYSAGVLACITNACSPFSNSSLSASFTNRCRATALYSPYIRQSKQQKSARSIWTSARTRRVNVPSLRISRSRLARRSGFLHFLPLALAWRNVLRGRLSRLILLDEWA